MPTKKVLYAKEQDQIIRSLIQILDLQNTSSLIRYNMDHDLHIINRIMSLVPSIRLYFTSSSISGILSPNKRIHSANVIRRHDCVGFLR